MTLFILGGLCGAAFVMIFTLIFDHLVVEPMIKRKIKEVAEKVRKEVSENG